MWPFSRYCTDMPGGQAGGFLQWETVASLPCPLPASWSLEYQRQHRNYDGTNCGQGSTWSKLVLSQAWCGWSGRCGWSSTRAPPTSSTHPHRCWPGPVCTGDLPPSSESGEEQIGPNSHSSRLPEGSTCRKVIPTWAYALPSTATP